MLITAKQLNPNYQNSIQSLDLTGLVPADVIDFIGYLIYYINEVRYYLPFEEVSDHIPGNENLDSFLPLTSALSTRRPELKESIYTRKLIGGVDPLQVNKLDDTSDLFIKDDYGVFDVNYGLIAVNGFYFRPTKYLTGTLLQGAGHTYARKQAGIGHLRIPSPKMVLYRDLDIGNVSTPIDYSVPVDITVTPPSSGYLPLFVIGGKLLLPEDGRHLLANSYSVDLSKFEFPESIMQFADEMLIGSEFLSLGGDQVASEDVQLFDVLLEKSNTFVAWIYCKSYTVERFKSPWRQSAYREHAAKYRIDTLVTDGYGRMLEYDRFKYETSEQLVFNSEESKAVFVNRSFQLPNYTENEYIVKLDELNYIRLITSN